jgi:hypothetical protein
MLDLSKKTSPSFLLALLVPAMLLGCPSPSEGTSTDTTIATSTDTTATSTDTTATSTGPEANTTEDCETGDCDVPCEPMTELEPIPEACVDLEVPPFEGRQLAGWQAGPNTLMAATHEAYHCLAPEFSLDQLTCACVGDVIVHQYDFGSSTFAVGETTVTLVAANASLQDSCIVSYEHFSDSVEDFPVAILATSDDCIIGETLGWEYNTRFYVARQACPG